MAAKRITSGEVEALLNKVDQSVFAEDVHVHQIRNVLRTMFVNKFSSDYLLFNLKDIGSFPRSYVTEFRILANKILRGCGRSVVNTDEDFLEGLK